MGAYASYRITIVGNAIDINRAIKKLRDTIPDQECFRFHSLSNYSAKEYDLSSSFIEVSFHVVKTHSCVWIEDIGDLANYLAFYIPALSFSISGRIYDCTDDLDDMMDFRINYRPKKLTMECTCWYIHIFMDNYVDYDAFCSIICDQYGNPRYSEEDYNGFRDCSNEWYVLDSGQGEFSIDISFDDPVRIKIKRP